MDEVILANKATIGLFMTLLGILLVSQDVSRIIKFSTTRKWVIAYGTVSATGTINALFRLITYTYSSGSRKYKSSQMMPRNSWVERLTIGSALPVRYNDNDPSSAIIDHHESGNYFLFATLNLVWIIVGLWLLWQNKP